MLGSFDEMLRIILISLVVLLLTLWLKRSWRIITTFQRLGIPGPTPNILFGNLLEILIKGQAKCHEEWTKKYGRVLGYYFGMTPALLVSDSSLLKNIFVKDFSNFMTREMHIILQDRDGQHRNSLSLGGSTGERWKRLRSILSPTFTTSKLKQMFGSIHHSQNYMMERLRKLSENNEEFDVYEVYREVILKLFAKSAFGLNINDQTIGKSKFFSYLAIAEIRRYNDPLTVVGTSIPFLRKLCIRTNDFFDYYLHGGTAKSYIGSTMLDIIEMRRQNPLKRNSDLIQLLADAYSSRSVSEVDDSELEVGESEDNEAKEDTEQVQDSKKNRFLTTEEIKEMSYSLFFAAFGTSSRFLAFATYYLAKYQDIQEKLYEEIKAYYEQGKTFEYLGIIKLPYLNKVFCEVLRIRPGVNFFSNRYAAEDVVYGDIKIPKDMLVQAPTYLIHHDPEYWDNPEDFNPERFDDDPNANGIKYLPFGIGPRNCIGKRFAEMELKLILAYIFYHYRIRLTRHQEYLPLIEYSRSMAPSRGIWIKVEKRHEYQPSNN